MNKKVLYLIVVILLLNFATVSFASVEINLNGTPSSWAQEEIAELTKFELLRQDAFRDYQNPITRGQFIYLAVRLYEAILGEEVIIENDIIFEDTTDEYALKGASVGITMGIGENKFGPNIQITREQLATLMIRALEKTGHELEIADSKFNDHERISDYAMPSVYKANYYGIVKGSNNNFSPLDNATIEQSLLIFKRTYEQFGTKPSKQLLDASEIADRVGKSVVFIQTYDKNGLLLGTGSGFVVDTSGKVVTNYHVIEGAYTAEIKTNDGNKYNVSYVLGYDPTKDIAVLKIDGNNLSKANLGDSSTVVQGQRILTLGSPIGLENTLSDGLISNKSRILDGQEYIQISAPISPGSSGGALINYYGEIIGVTTAQFVNGQNLNLAIPINEVIPYLNISGTKKLSELAESKFIGTIQFDNGVYEGEIKSGLMHGLGKYTWTDGAYYKGEFSDGYFHGIGAEYYPDGTFFKGRWEYGEYVENLMIPVAYANSISTTEVDIGWYKIDLAYYNVYYADSPNGPWYYFEDSDGLKSNIEYKGEYSATLYGIDPGITMYFKVSSVIFDIESAPSEIVVVTLPASTSSNIIGPLYLYSDEMESIYLGKLTTNSYERESIFNEYGPYGSSYARESIFNEYGPYGSSYSTYSAFNEYATSPPLIIDGNGNIVGRLTVNDYVIGAISPYEIYSLLEHLGF